MIAPLEMLAGLEGREVRVQFTDDSTTTGKLTAIKGERLEIDAGDGIEGGLFPAAIELDGEVSYTHALISIRSIKLAAADRTARPKRVAPQPQHTTTAKVKPRRVVKFRE